MFVKLFRLRQTVILMLIVVVDGGVQQTAQTQHNNHQLQQAGVATRQTVSAGRRRHTSDRERRQASPQLRPWAQTGVANCAALGI